MSANFDHIALPHDSAPTAKSATSSGEMPGYREATEKLAQDMIGSGYTPDAARARAEGVAKRHKSTVRRTR